MEIERIRGHTGKLAHHVERADAIWEIGKNFKFVLVQLTPGVLTCNLVGDI
ncbi:hypothetical protein H9P43_005498 [Blastocladiella emersonii ATCC 22665]|nr:hypothetical protein H9P43_005498 [Blastocladiella emersonii ATCC 22665]